MGKKKNEEEKGFCPVGEFFLDIEKIFGEKSTFFKHLTQSKIEFLKAIRSLIDERIDGLEKKRQAGAGKKMTKIKVE